MPIHSSRNARQASGDDARTSVEMFPTRPSHDLANDSKDGLIEESRGKSTFKTAQISKPTLLKKSLVGFGLLVALSAIVLLAAAAEVTSQSYIRGRDCYPNGLWRESTGATWRIMDSSYIFTPNLSFGAMTFTQVKVIDIFWDVLIGRVGQMLLAWVNYRVFNEWLLYHMELHLTSYKMYTAVAFQTTTLSTLGVLAKEFLAFGRGTWSRFFRWLAVLCMLLSTLYVLAFPTLMAAMTGYITTYEPYVEDLERNLIDWDKISPVRYIVSDSSRINESYTSPLIATEADTRLVAAIKNYTEHYTNITIMPNVPPVAYSLRSNRSSTFVFDGKVTELEAPSLNITFLSTGKPELSISPGLVHYYYSLDNSRQGILYDSEYVHTHGSCKPSETYQWGFSYIFLFMVSIFNFVWACIMAGMWFDTTRASRMYRSGRRPGLLRSIMDISGAIREELGSRDVEHLEEEELKKRLRESGGALLVPRSELRVTRTAAEDVGLKQRSWRRQLTRGSTF